MAMRIHYQPPERLKINFGDFEQAMFHDVERPCEITFCILCIEKSVLGEVV
jgi:hypothetical protein